MTDLLIYSIHSKYYLSLSRRLLEDLEYPEILQFAIKDNYLYIGEKIPDAYIETTYEYSGSLYSIIDDAVLDYILAGFTLDFRRRIAKTADVYDKEYNGELLRYAKIKMCG